MATTGTFVDLTAGGGSNVLADLAAITGPVALNGQAITSAEVQQLRLAAQSGIRAMWVGDSLTGTGGATPMLGSSRIQAFADSRARGLNLRAYGRQAQGRTGYLVPYEPWADGNAGYSIEDVTALFGGTATGAPNNVSVPASKNFVVANGAPDVILLMIGTNNVSGLGDSAAACETKLTTLLAQITQVCPTTRVIIETIPSFYSPAAPSGGLAGANAIVAAFNAWIVANVPALNALYSVVDCAASFSNDTAHSDGYHLTIAGQSSRGRLEVAEIARLFPQRTSAVIPRPFKPRIQQSSVNLPVAGTSTLVVAADNGWRLPAANFLYGMRCRLLAYTAATTNYIVTSYPDSYAHGWAITLETTANPPTYNVYVGGAAVLTVAAPVVLGQHMWLFAHGDRAAGIVSLWMAMPMSAAPGAPWVLACVGGVQGVAAWAQAQASPQFALGNDALGRGGVAMDADNAFFATGAGVPGAFAIRDALESIVFDGTDAPGVVASIRCTEGSGASAASGVGGQAGSITGGWTAAGKIPWPCDDVLGLPPPAPGVSSIAMADAAQTIAAPFSTIEPTGAITADRALTLPAFVGFVFTINNKTTGGKNIVATVAGATVNCPFGISRVYFDGTNVIDASVGQHVVTGTFTLNGVTQVDVAGNFPINATISWSLATVGTTPGVQDPYFSAANTAGHFFVKSPTALANDVYNWRAHW